MLELKKKTVIKVKDIFDELWEGSQGLRIRQRKFPKLKSKEKSGKELPKKKKGGRGGQLPKL